MAIKDLAVAFNGSGNSKAALAFAIQMCRKYDAALTGLHVHLPLTLEPQLQRWTPKKVLESLKTAGEEGVRSIETEFRDEVAAAGFEGAVDWVVEEGQINEHLARLSRYYDLLVIGQFSEAGDKKRVTVRAEDLVLRSGKPLLIVPNGYQVQAFEEYAAVAWDGSRPAARALSDAMQILETKKRLDVVRVVAEGQPPPPDSDAARSVIRHLRRHGIDARRVGLSASKDGVGPAILGHCAENRPDVLVMGAYGHARLREELFGGVTRHILRNMNVPILMSH
jgi:nucleotide-binding universal stress UspA family protein